MTEQNYSHRFSRFYPSLAVVVREARALYKGSLCVRFKNVPHDTQGWCIHLYTEQPDRGIEKEWREQEGNTHGRLHTFPTAGGGIRCTSTADENRDRPKPIGERQKERDVGKREGRMSIVAVVAREHRRGREKKRERERGREGEGKRDAGKGPSHESSLFSLP